MNVRCLSYGESGADEIKGMDEVPMRGALTGLIIGCLAGTGFAFAAISLTPFLLVPLDTVFGLGLGLIAGLLTRLLNTLLSEKSKPRINKIVAGLIYGAMIGAIILMPLGADGWLLTAYLAVEGAIMGGFLGVVIGVILQMTLKRHTDNESLEL